MTTLLEPRPWTAAPPVPAARPLAPPPAGPGRHRPPAVRRCARDRAAVRRRLQRRRRVTVAVIAGGLLVALALPWGGAGGTLTPSGPALVPHTLYVVQPGDTLWSIAVRLDPSGDPRPLVDQMASETGSDTVTVGEALRLP